MANKDVVYRILDIPQLGNTGDVLTILSNGDAGFQPAPGGTVGPGTPGTIGVFAAANSLQDNLPGSDTTLSVPNGQVGVFAINGVSLVRFTSAGFSPTVNGGVASGDAAHVWANVYGRNLLSDTALGLEAAAGQLVKLRVNGADILTIGAPGVPTTWTWPTVDAAGPLQSNGAGALTFGAIAGGWTVVSKTADQSSSAPGTVVDNALFTASLAPGKWRVQVNVFFGAAGAGGFAASLTVPANTFLRCHMVQQGQGGAAIGTSGSNIGTTVPTFFNGNAGQGWLFVDLIITVSVAGVVNFTWDSLYGGNTATIFAGSYLQYMAV